MIQDTQTQNEKEYLVHYLSSYSILYEGESLLEACVKNRSWREVIQGKLEFHVDEIEGRAETWVPQLRTAVSTMDHSGEQTEELSPQ